MLLTACATELQQCEGYAPVEALGPLENTELKEASGLAVSPAQSILWSHNDRGDSARVFAVGMDGSDQGVWVLAGVDVQDLEDIAFDPQGRVVLGDIGDNQRRRDSVRIIRFAEPDASTGGGTVTVESFELVYEDGPQDSEALAVDPQTGDIFLFEKDASGRVSVHRADLEAGTLTRAHRFRPPGEGDQAITAADFTPDGERLLLRTRDRVLVYNRAVGGIEATLAGTPCVGPVAQEAQGESLGAATWGYVTVSEGPESVISRANRR